jgi:hypothetical protein
VISAPLLVFSPAFWVYWDLAQKADAKVGAWIDAQELSERMWAGSRALMFARITGAFGRRFESILEINLQNLSRSEFDPGLLDWDRKLAEALVKAHSRLFKEWTKLSNSFPKGKPAKSTRPVRTQSVVYRPIPRHLSLVPMSTYRGYPWDRVLYSYPRPRLWDNS